MKKLTVLLLCVLGLETFCIAQISCVFNSSGSFSGRTYTNTKLGLSYTYPEAFSPQDSNLPTDPKGKSSILFALWKSPRDMDTPNLIVLMDDPTKYPDSTSIGYLHRIENTVVRRNAKILSSTPFDLAGIKFYRLDYQFSGADAVLNSSITGQIGKCEVSFEIRAHTQQEVEKLVQSVKAIKLVEQRP